MIQAEEQHEWKSWLGKGLSATVLGTERRPAVPADREQQEMVQHEAGGGGRDWSLQNLKGNVKGLYFILTAMGDSWKMISKEMTWSYLHFK